MSEIANLSVVVGANISALERGLRTADDKIQSFADGVSNKFASLGVGLINVGTQLTALTAPLVEFGRQGIDVAANFESAMAEISARTGLTGDALAEISDLAIQLGADTAFSAQQAADAFLQLLSSGQSAEEAMQTIPVILDAAAASGEDLGRTADVVTDILASFGLEVEDAGDVVDILAKAAGASSADMSSLGQGFANVGGVAKAMGLTVQDTAAILAIFSENGIKGAEAGTQLKSMLLNMTRGTEDTQAAWDELGTSFYDDAGNVRDLRDIIADLDAALDQLPAEEQNRLMKALGGSYGIMGLTALRGSISIDEMKDSMQGQASAAEVAQARMNTFKGAMDSLMGSIESLMITAFTPLMEDFLTPLAQDVTELINQFTDWADANPELANTIIMIGGALAIAGPALVALGTAITLAAPAVGLLAGALALLVSPVALVAAGIAGLAFIASQVIDFNALASQIQTGAGIIVDAVSAVDFSALPQRFLEELNNALFQLTDDDFAPPISAFINHFQTALSAALSTGNFSFIGEDFGNAITKSFTQIDFSGITPIMGTHFNDILGAIVSVVGIVLGGPIGLAIGAASLVSKAIETDFLGIGTFLEQSGISTAVSDALANVKATIDGLISSIFGGGEQAGGAGFWDGLMPKEETGATGPLAVFASDLQRGAAALAEIAGNIWENIGPGLSDLAEGIGGFLSNLATADTEGLLRVVTVIGGAIGGILAKGLEFGSAVVGEALSALGNALPEIGSFIAGIISAISDMGEGNWGEVLPDLGQALIDFGQAVLNFAGVDIQIPDFDTMIAGWRTFAESLSGIIQFHLDNVAVGFRTFGRDIEEFINRLQIGAADVQLALGINWEANAAARDEAIANVNAIETAELIEKQLNDSLAAGNVSIDASQFLTSDPAAIAAKIADPTLIQAALNTALAEGDQATFDVLAPIAMELGMDTEQLIADYQAKLAEGANATIYPVSVPVAVTVNPASIDMSPVNAAIQAMAGGQIPALPGAGVPHLASGGAIAKSGLAMVHAGEVVLNPQQQAAVGGGGNSVGAVNISSDQSPEQIVSGLKRLGIDLYEIANRTNTRYEAA